MNAPLSNKVTGDILVVDDDLNNLQVLSDTLMKQGYDVLGARSGTKALDFIENDPPDLVLLDVRMPEMDGYEVCKRLKADKRYAHLPVIFLSALQASEDRVRGFEVGGVDFISKPFQREEVLVRVDTHLALSRLNRNLELLVEKRTAELTESKEALAEQLQFERRIAEIAARLANVQPETIDAQIQETLSSLGRLLKSERAFVFQFTDDGKSLKNTHVWAAEGVSTNAKIFEMNMALDFPWLAETIRSGRIINIGPGLNGFPDEARELRRQLEREGINSGCVVPVTVQGRSIGLLGVDTVDQPREYPTPLVDRLKLVADMIGSAVQRIRAQLSLIEQLQFEDLISNLSATFINIKASEIDKNIERGLKLVVQHLDLDRGNLFEFSRGNEKLTLTHSSAREGMKHSPRGHYSNQHPWFTQKLLNGEMFCFSQPTDLPKEAKAEKEYLLQQGIQSAMVVPLEAAGIIQGGITLSSIKWERQWPEHLLEQCKILAQVFSNALLRKRADKKISETLVRIRELNARMEQENIYLRDEIELRHRHEEIIGKSEPVMDMLSRAEQVAETDATVLILGETGTGKELMANAIHRLSRRKDRTMIKVNCAALPATLIESELFGREKGAYTGAMSRQIGRFEIADGSTLFLDEIGEMPLELQSKLLRVLQEGQFERLGSPETITTDVRIITSTNRDLARAVREGTFREDLYYRLNVFSVIVPPLRDRVEDIPLLVWAFVKEYESSMGKTIHTIPKSSLDRLQKYTWPGNIRELKNVIENAMIITTSKTLHIIPPVDPSVSVQKAIKLADVERNHIKDVLKRTSWRVSGTNGAADLLGLKPTTLESRMKKLGITRPR